MTSHRRARRQRVAGSQSHGAPERRRNGVALLKKSGCPGRSEHDEPSAVTAPGLRTHRNCLSASTRRLDIDCLCIDCSASATNVAETDTTSGASELQILATVVITEGCVSLHTPPLAGRRFKAHQVAPLLATLQPLKVLVVATELVVAVAVGLPVEPPRFSNVGADPGPDHGTAEDCDRIVT